MSAQARGISRVHCSSDSAVAQSLMLFAALSGPALESAIRKLYLGLESILTQADSAVTLVYDGVDGVDGASPAFKPLLS